VPEGGDVKTVDQDKGGREISRGLGLGALSGTSARHFGIRPAILVNIADTGLGLHVDIWIRRVFAGDARADFQHRRIGRAAVL
jgi:hypothetical protein